MKKLVLIALMSVAAALPAAAQNGPAKREMVYDATGRRLALVDRVMPNGDVEIIVNDKEVTLPASTLSTADGKVTTTLTKPQVVELPR